LGSDTLTMRAPARAELVERARTAASTSASMPAGSTRRDAERTPFSARPSRRARRRAIRADGAGMLVASQRIGAGHDLEQRGRVLDGAPERPGVIERRRERDDAVARDAP
jgi:hypothetical protein